VCVASYLILRCPQLRTRLVLRIQTDRKLIHHNPRAIVYLSGKALPKSARPSLPRPIIGVECEEIRDRLSEPARHSFKFLERRCVSSALDQTQEIDGDANQFRKFLLCFGRFITNLADAKPELFL
jgi:hypothetical protein